jgi:hypothetical protein
LYLDGLRILPTALLDVYESKEKPRIEIEQSEENIECKRTLMYIKSSFGFLSFTSYSG